MAAIFNQLATIIVVIIAWQTLVKCQDATEYEPNDENVNYYSGLQRLFNSITAHRAQQKNKLSAEDTEGSQLTGSYADDDRQFRSVGQHDQSDHACRIVFYKTTDLTNSEFEYRPNFVEEAQCQRVQIDTGTTYNEKICYTRGSGCQTETRQVYVYKRLRNQTCWNPEIRHVAVGCRCFFDKKYMEMLTFKDQ